VTAKTPTLFEMLKTALYIGTIGYGGPAILALMKRVIAHEKKWISEEEFMNALSLVQVLPGPAGATLLGYIGHRLRGLWGGILVPSAFVFPAMAAITVLAWAYFRYGNLAFVQSIFMGLGGLVVALLLNATLLMGRSVFKKVDRNSYKGFVISALAFLGIYLLKWNVIYIVLISGALGVFFFYFSGEFEQEKVPARLKIEMDIPKKPAMVNFLPVAILATLLAVIFWIVPGTWTIFATFFKIGMFAFGGGFTAIPIIQHEVVDAMHWLDLTSFRDGIALGQITPGPVFITATFIGYKVKGIIGAFVATVGVFAPSLTAIMFVGKAHAKIKNLKIMKVVIKGFLSGFIGLLLAVTLQFGFHSLVSWQTWSISILSGAYLIWWKKDVAWLVLAVIAVSLFVF
jgi:chromate transporter